MTPLPSKNGTEKYQINIQSGAQPVNIEIDTGNNKTQNVKIGANTNATIEAVKSVPVSKPPVAPAAPAAPVAPVAPVAPAKTAPT